MRTQSFALHLLLLAAFPVLGAELPPDHAARMTKGLALFQARIRPLLIEHCVKCHGGEKTKGDFDLTTREALLQGGADGPVLVPFNAGASVMLKQMRHEEEPHMPDKKPRLPDAVLAEVAAWIEAGAPYDKPLIEGRQPPRNRSVVSAEDRQWWAFQPLARVALPKGDAHPIDYFLVAKAAEKQLTFAPAAERRTLLRRAHLGLLGVPPAPEEVEAFERDSAPDAWSKVVDRLLASNHYGERWARHWLDVARFAESSGFEHDYDRPGAFHYRDFVIKALNADLPYDQFIRWQLAGDEFAPDNPLAFSATGFLGAGVFPTQITANEVERTRYDAMDDMLSTTGSAFLGLTVGCARCHDHKYDPIPASDYYQLLSTFTTTVRSVLDLDMEPEQTRAALAKWEKERAPLAAELARHEQELEPKFDDWFRNHRREWPLPGWIALDLAELKSKGGATFRKLEDHSYLAEGKNADQDEYTIIGRSAVRRIAALRLDALAHASMTNGGPGRAANGNIGLSRIQVFVTPAKGAAPREIKIGRAEADFEQNKGSLSIAAALDDQPGSGWAIDPQFGKDHAAVFHFAEPLELPEDGSLTVRLEFRLNAKHNIGRVRLSVGEAPAASWQASVLPAAVAAALQKAQRNDAYELNPGERGAVFDWWKRRDEQHRKLTAQLDEQARKRPDGKTRVLVCAEGHPPLRMHTQGADFFPETYFLKRGSTELKEGVASQGFLQVLNRAPDGARRWIWAPPEAAKFSGRRRSLANWITDVEHGAGGLAARVIVNRLWQHHFGRGIVATPNDFGRTGALPSHPELLDWLAGELIRNGWRLKPLHRLILTSRAYEQSSARDPMKETADPENVFFLRRIPQRLEGEAIRDSMLAVAGVLDPTMFGPGTRDERSRRRSIYFTVKRSELIGSMVAFDAPEPLISQGSRPTTTVAPQALLLLNGVQVREWAEAFAGRLGPDPIQSAYLHALSRAPTSTERAEAAAFLATQTQRYAAAGKPNGSAVALADFCQVLFGLNEFVYSH